LILLALRGKACGARTGERVLVLVLELVVDGSGSCSKKSELALTPALAL
jgi:hypothetical protein